MGRGRSHIDNSLMARAMADEFARVPATRVMQEGWEKTLEAIREEELRSHEEAAFILHDFKVTGRPFALYLRSFGTEASHSLTPEDDPKGQRFLVAGHAQSECESGLAAGLAGRIRAVGVANPDQMTSGNGRLPRVLLPNEGWEAVVEDLIGAASFIVMECSELAPGVLREFEMLRAAKREATTVVVLPAEGAEAEAERELKTIEIFGGVVERHKRPERESDELRGFHRVAREDEIAFDKLEESPLFADLLAAAKVKAAAAPVFDGIGHAKQLNAAGVGMFQEGRYGEAADLLVQAGTLQRHLGDRSGLLTTLLNTANNLVDAGQPEDALQVYEEALEIAVELRRVADEGLLRSYIGLSYKLLGRIDDAKKWLHEAYAIQRLTGEQEDIEATLVALNDLGDLKFLTG